MRIYLVLVTLALASADHYFPRRYPTFTQLSDHNDQEPNATQSSGVENLPTGSTIFNVATPSPEAANTLYKAALQNSNQQKAEVEYRLPAYAEKHTESTVSADNNEPRTNSNPDTWSTLNSYSIQDHKAPEDHSTQISHTNQIPQAFNSHSTIDVPQQHDSSVANNFDSLPVAEPLISQKPSSSYNSQQTNQNNLVETYPEHDFEQVQDSVQDNRTTYDQNGLSNFTHLSEQQDRRLKYEYSLSNHVTPSNSVPMKSQRLFPNFWLKYYNYPRMVCMAAVGLTGTCYTKQQCRVLGGTVYGICARGYGVCCIVRRTCGAVTSLNRTYFSNPEYPSSSMNAAGSCTLVITRPSRPTICQVRLDFHEFQLMPPVGGDCVRDRFLIAGHNANNVIPPLCGVNSGQHLYFDIDQLRSPFALTVSTSGQGQRRWDIAVTFIDCYSRNRAPANCLQYYEGGDGYFRSFNYMPTAPVAMTGGYLNNLNYAICFRREIGACSQTYMTNSTMASFDIMNVNDNNAPTLGNAEAGLGLVECPNDFIELGGLRYCGTRLNPSLSPANPNYDAPIVDDTTGPFMAKVVSNAVVNGIGFQIGFTQNPCRITYPGVQQNGKR